MNWPLSHLYGEVRDAIIAQVEDEVLLHSLRGRYAHELDDLAVQEASLANALMEEAS